MRSPVHDVGRKPVPGRGWPEARSNGRREVPRGERDRAPRHDALYRGPESQHARPVDHRSALRREDRLVLTLRTTE